MVRSCPWTRRWTRQSFAGFGRHRMARCVLIPDAAVRKARFDSRPDTRSSRARIARTAPERLADPEWILSNQNGGRAMYVSRINSIHTLNLRRTLDNVRCRIVPPPAGPDSSRCPSRRKVSLRMQRVLGALAARGCRTPRCNSERSAVIVVSRARRDRTWNHRYSPSAHRTRISNSAARPSSTRAAVRQRAPGSRQGGRRWPATAVYRQSCGRGLS